MSQETQELAMPAPDVQNRSNSHYTEEEKEFFRKAVRQYWNKIPIKDLTAMVHGVLKSTRTLGAVQTQLYTTYHEMEKEIKRPSRTRTHNKKKIYVSDKIEMGKAHLTGKLYPDKRQFRAPIKSIKVEDNEVIFSF